VLVADELSPSVAAQIDWTRVRGLVSDVGAPTHHTVILVRSLAIPAVVGLGGATGLIAPGQTIALDGASGEVVIDPPEDVVERWRQRAEASAAAARVLDELRDQPAVTADGVRITLEANLEIADEVHRVIDAAPRASGCIDRSSCSIPAPRWPDRRISSSRSIAACWRPCSHGR